MIRSVASRGRPKRSTHVARSAQSSSCPQSLDLLPVRPACFRLEVEDADEPDPSTLCTGLADLGPQWRIVMNLYRGAILYYVSGEQHNIF